MAGSSAIGSWNSALHTSLLERESAGYLRHFVGGTAISTTMSGGGIQEVHAGGVASDTIVRGGYQQVDAGGSAFDSIITSKGLTFIEAGANGVDAIVGSGGTMKVAGEARDPIISGGLLDLVEGYSTDGILGFASDVGVLKIEGTTMPSTPIRHLVKGDLIDLASVPFGFGNVVVLGGTVLRIAVSGSRHNHAESLFVLYWNFEARRPVLFQQILRIGG